MENSHNFTLNEAAKETGRSKGTISKALVFSKRLITRTLLRTMLFLSSGESLFFFVKACFGHPSPSKQQKLNATANAFGAPDVLRTCHFATTIVNSVLASSIIPRLILWYRDEKTSASL
jgi:hypothetical protein